MNLEHLVRMANQIGRFYEAFPDRAEGLAGTASHIRRSWDPRMRLELFEHIDQDGGIGLDEFVAEALKGHRKEVEPRTTSPS